MAPSRIEGGPARRAWPAGLIGMLGLVFAVELGVGRNSDDWTHPAILEWRATRRDAATRALGCDVLYLGSSMMKNGALPQIVEAEAPGRRGFNLALPGSKPAAAYFVLRRAIGRGARPSAVVVDFSHSLLYDDPCTPTAIAVWSQLLGPVEALELALTRREPEFGGRLIAASALPSVRARHEIRAAVQAALDGRPLSFAQPSREFARNRRANRGARVNAKVPDFRDETPLVVRNEERYRASLAWRCDPVNAAYLDRFLNLAEANHVAVYWVMMPHPPGYQALLDAARSEGPFQDEVRRLAGRFANLTLVDGRHAGFPASVFVDHIHVDADGAASFSRSLAEVLRRGPAGPDARWVDLPAYRDPRWAVEDLNESAKVLARAAGPVRR